MFAIKKIWSFMWNKNNRLVLCILVLFSLKGCFCFLIIARSQSYDLELQRQGCKNLQRLAQPSAIWKQIFSSSLKKRSSLGTKIANSEVVGLAPGQILNCPGTGWPDDTYIYVQKMGIFYGFGMQNVGILYCFLVYFTSISNILLSFG
jgi:hypothetical protein